MRQLSRTDKEWIISPFPTPKPSRRLRRPEVEVVAGTFEEQKQESQTTDPESSLRGQTPEQVEGERRVEFATMKQAVATMKERGHIDEFVGHIQEQDWTESRS